MPEAERLAEIDRQQNPGDHRAPERERICGPNDGPVLGAAEPCECRAQKERAPRDATDEEVRNDEPGPMRRARKEGVRHSCLPSPSLPCAVSESRLTPADRAPRPSRLRTSNSS